MAGADWPVSNIGSDTQTVESCGLQLHRIADRRCPHRYGEVCRSGESDCSGRPRRSVLMHHTDPRGADLEWGLTVLVCEANPKRRTTDAQPYDLHDRLVFQDWRNAVRADTGGWSLRRRRRRGPTADPLGLCGSRRPRKPRRLQPRFHSQTLTALDAGMFFGLAYFYFLILCFDAGVRLP